MTRRSTSGETYVLIFYAIFLFHFVKEIVFQPFQYFSPVKSSTTDEISDRGVEALSSPSSDVGSPMFCCFFTFFYLSQRVVETEFSEKFFFFHRIQIYLHRSEIRLIF
eukprot:UN00505